MSDLNVYSTTAAVNALTPVDGDMVVDTEANAVKVYCNSAWKVFNNDGSPAYENRWGASFDAGDYLNSGTTSALNGVTNASYSFWYKTSSTGVVGLMGGGAGTSVYHWSNGNIIVHGFVDQNSHGVPQPTLGSWHNIICTFEASGSKLYVDGVYKSLVDNGDVTASDAFTNFLVGKVPHYSSVMAAGEKSMDEVAFWSATLSDGGGLSIDDTAGGDIEKIYNGGVPQNLTLAASYATDRTANLKGYWRMGDDSNDSPSSDPASNKIITITDSSGNGNDATQGSATNQPTFKALPQSNTALDFNGSTEFLTINASANNSLHNGGSWSFWMHHSVASSGGTPIFTDMSQTDYMAVNFHANRLNIYSKPDQHDTNFQPSTGWNFITLTATGNSISVHQFSNDYPTGRVFTKTLSSVPNLSTSEVYFAKSGWGASRFFDGMLNDIAFFSNALSASELTAMYNSGAPIDLTSDSGNYSSSSSLVGYWRMGDDDSLTDGQTGITQISDASGNGNHATQATASSQPTASVEPVIYV